MFKFLSRIIDDPDPVIVMPYGGFANHEMIHAQARVLEDEGISHTEEDGILKNIWNSYKRFESDEKENANVKVTWADQERLLISDEEGYVYLDEPHFLNVDHEETLWIPMTYELLDKGKVIHKVTTQIMKPGSKADFGVITDMDDTILDTGVTSAFKWRVLVNSFMKHSHRRMPLEGSSELYNLLHKGPSGYNTNPFFYLSNSPWNIYDYLTAFLQNHDFPNGILMLRDIGTHLLRKTHYLEGNKFTKAQHILESFPNLTFLLIGDAGESDTHIYLELSKQFPDQIPVIYIRTVSKKSKMKAIEKLIEENTDISVVLIHEGNEAIEHARENGFIE